MATRVRKNRVGGGARSEVNRWNTGAPSLGEDFHPGFVTPYNERGPYWEIERIATIGPCSMPATMGAQMGADEYVMWTPERGGRRRGRRRY